MTIHRLRLGGQDKCTETGQCLNRLRGVARHGGWDVIRIRSGGAYVASSFGLDDGALQDLGTGQRGTPGNSW